MGSTTVTPFAWRALDVLGRNRDHGAASRRHAIAYAFVYALLDLADAIRGRTDG